MDIEGLAAGLEHFDTLLGSPELEPDPSRTDWPSLQTRVSELVHAYRADLLEPVRALLPVIPEDDLARAAASRVARQCGALAALLGASGDLAGAARLCAEGASLARGSDAGALLDAGVDEPEAFATYGHARWLQRRASSRSDKVAKAAKAKAKGQVLKNAADEILRGPKPIQSAPPLFRLNGCGAGLYGSSRHDDDGFYTALYCVCFLWIPVLPLSAYRVRDAGSGSYQFLYRERLGTLARLWRATIASALAGTALFAAYSSYTSSDDYRASEALNAAAAAEARGDRDDALTLYRGVTTSYARTTPGREAASALVRLSLDGLPTPCTESTVEPARRLLAGVLEVPAEARKGEPEERFQKRLAECAQEIDSATLAGARGRLAMLELAADVGASGGDALAPGRAKAEHAIAQQLASSRPVDALAHEIHALDDPEARAGAERLVTTIAPIGSLALEAEDDLDTFERKACNGGQRSPVCDVWKSSIAEAKAVRDALGPVVESGDVKALARLTEAHPKSHEVAVARASMERLQGDTKTALRTLAALGEPGFLTSDAQRVLASIYADEGDLAKADALLTALVEQRLPAFQAAQRAYFPAISRKQAALVAEAQAGLHPSLDQRVQGKSEDEIRELFVAWIAEQVQKDANLAQLRESYVRAGGVVPSVLSLGMLKVRRAADASGAERPVMLRDAEALFLAIRGEAEGDPSFHMGLGQVYHRLGKPDDGEKELAAVLAQKKSYLSMQVAMAYRELGLDVRARAVLEDVHATAKADDERFDAAAARASVAIDMEDRKAWIDRTNPKTEQGRVSRLDVAATIALRDGKRPKAAKLFGEVAAFYERDAKHSAPAANNAAVAYLGRYAATGDMADVRRAVAAQESAVKLQPDNAILVGHLADVVLHLGLVTVLDRFVHTSVLGLERSDAATIVDDLLEGPSKEELKRALSSNAAVRRVLLLSRDEQVLAPGKQSAYVRTRLILGFLGDDAQILELTKRIDAVPAFDASERAESRRKWERHENDVTMRRSATEGLRTCDRRLGDARADGHALTIAVALRLCADAAGFAAVMDLATPHGDEATLLQEARTSSPALGLDAHLAHALLLRGTHTAAREEPALAAAMEQDWRAHGTAMTIQRAVVGTSGAGVLAVLRRNADVVAAVKLIADRRLEDPGTTTYLLAVISGDAKRVTEVLEATNFERLLIQARSAVKLYPGEPAEQARLELVEALAKKAP
jgi:hypothetical protein